MASQMWAALPGRVAEVVEGEVWLRAQSMAAGYWRNGVLLPLVNAQGWFATAIAVKFTTDG
jgi:O-succinylbenzoic acid--CoA ligase